MTQENKELLLKDLCARLPYGVVVVLDEKFGFNKGTRPLVKELLDLYCVEGIKPYLRPMSSMTEEEREDFYQNVLDMDIEDVRYENDGKLPLPYNQKDKFIWFENIYLDNTFAVIDWLNAHHFDYRGLIENGLALEAPEKLYIALNELTEDGRTFVLDHRVDYPICTEYTRTDAFIEKACEWLKEHKEHPFIGCEDPCLSGYLTDEFIEDFKNYLKGE